MRGKKNQRPVADGTSTGVKQVKVTKERIFLPEKLSLLSYARSAELHTTKEGLRDTLSKFGVAIIPFVLSEKECQDFEQGVWDALNKLSAAWPKPITKEDESSWTGFSQFFASHAMLLQHYGIGHAEFVWTLRQNPKVLEIFSLLWKVKPEELLVSFDGMSVHLPPEVTEKGFYRNNTWYHTDQHFTDGSPFECVQSWVTAREVRPGDATLTVLLGSHKFHGEYAARFGYKSVKDDFHQLKKQAELDWFIKEKGCEAISIACPAGSMVFWDSRTMHAGQEALPSRPEQNVRMAVYLCYTPRSLATNAFLTRKRKMFDAVRMMSHWPHRAITFGKGPQLWGKTQLPITPFGKPTNVTPLGMKLAGF